MNDLSDLSIDARRAEMDYRIAKLARTRHVRLNSRHWWHRTGTVAAASTTN
jgi:hypothetical protein